MELRRFQLEGTSLPELQERVRIEHGHDARIVKAEQVTVGGIRGFFASRHIEVTVEVPVAVFVEVAPTRRRHARDELTTRLGIAALLDDADEAEARLSMGSKESSGPAPVLPSTLGAASGGDGVRPANATRGTVPAAPVSAAPGATAPAPAALVSTGTPDVARLMDDLTFATARDRGVSDPRGRAETPTDAVGTEALPEVLRAEARQEARPQLTPGAPRILAGPGDLILLIGIHADALEVARTLSDGPQTPILEDIGRIVDRRTALAARARGVEEGRSILVVCGLPGPTMPGSGGHDAPATGAALSGTMLSGAAPPVALTVLSADQAWAVVHAGRKPADTASWVRDVGAVVTLDAIAVLGIESTGTPGTVSELGLPIGWLAPAPAAAAPAGSAGSSYPFAIG